MSRVLPDLLADGTLRWHPRFEVFVTDRYQPALHSPPHFPPNPIRSERERPKFYDSLHRILSFEILIGLTWGQYWYTEATYEP